MNAPERNEHAGVDEGLKDEPQMPRKFVELANKNDLVAQHDLFCDRAKISELDGAETCGQAVEDLRRAASVKKPGVRTQLMMGHRVPAA